MPACPEPLSGGCGIIKIMKRDGGNRSWRDGIYFVLVEPKEQGNIGSAARAIKNMGFGNLCLVRPQTPIEGEAAAFACNARDVLDSADVFDSVEDAVADKSLVVGTTRRMGRHRGLAFPAEEGCRRVFESSGGNRIAILFGRESRGLLNEEVEQCGFLINIPSSRLQPSLNLSHAVLLVAYELSKAEYASVGGPSASASLVPQREVGLLFDRVTSVLKLLEYIPRGDTDLEEKIMRNLRHFIGRAGLTRWELNMLHGVITQIERRLK